MAVDVRFTKQNLIGWTGPNAQNPKLSTSDRWHHGGLERTRVEFLSGRALICHAQYLVDRVSRELVKCTEQALYMCSCFVGYFAESIDSLSYVHAEIRPKSHPPFRLRSDSLPLLLTTGQDSY